MAHMIRKQIYLTKDLDRYITLLAQQMQKPKAEVIRTLLERSRRSEQTITTGEALLGLAKLGKTFGMAGPTDLSERHDDYLYGDDK